MNKRAQAAMEFLMTYGWAIIIVLAAIGALAYFGVLSPQKLLPERTTFPAPLPNVDNAVITVGGSVDVAFKNNKGVSINNFLNGTWTSTGSSACNSGILSNVLNTSGGLINTATTPISNGDAFIVNWTCTPPSGVKVGDRFSADISFKYTNVDTGQILTETGSIQGKYS